MGLSVLQKWMVEGRGLGVNRTGVWTDTQQSASSESRDESRDPAVGDECLPERGM